MTFSLDTDEEKARYEARPPSEVKIPQGVWLTKHALTQGIQYAEHAYQCFDVRWDHETKDWVATKTNYVQVSRTKSYGFGSTELTVYNNKDAHFSLEAAQARVKVLVDAKRKNMLKTLAALESKASVLTTIPTIPEG